jgi:hypothetical protein
MAGGNSVPTVAWGEGLMNLHYEIINGQADKTPTFKAFFMTSSHANNFVICGYFPSL